MVSAPELDRMLQLLKEFRKMGLEDLTLDGAGPYGTSSGGYLMEAHISGGGQGREFAAEKFRALEGNIRTSIIEMIPRLESVDSARIRAEEEKTRAALVAAGREEESTPMPFKKVAEYGRNDLVTLRKGNETKEIKFKKAEPLLATGKWRIVE